MRTIRAALFVIGLQAFGQSISLVNTSNNGLNDPVYGADFVAGDNFVLTINGAAPLSAVTVIENGGSPTYMGQTDVNGHWSVSGTETSAYIGYYEQAWYINGVQVGPDLVFDVIDVPDHLTVNSLNLAALPAGCNGGTYGIMVDIKYNIKAQNGTNIQTGIPLTPYEQIWFYGNFGVYLSYTEGNIGPVSGYPTSSASAAPDGTFHDVPVGTCANGVFQDAGADQNIFIEIGDSYYGVRSHSLYTYGPSPGHGSISNTSDINKTR